MYYKSFITAFIKYLYPPLARRNSLHVDRKYKFVLYFVINLRIRKLTIIHSPKHQSKKVIKNNNYFTLIMSSNFSYAKFV